MAQPPPDLAALMRGLSAPPGGAGVVWAGCGLARGVVLGAGGALALTCEAGVVAEDPPPEAQKKYTYIPYDF